jgi:CubicO group peptidase (beta-lactamase class C family)
VGCSVSAASTRGINQVIRDTDAQAQTEFAKDNVGSLTVGIVSQGKLVWTKSYGMADMQRRLPANRQTIYRIGSVTKQLTALMLLQLVEAGKVHFADPVESYLPEIKRVQNPYPYAPPITLVQLATHTSGVDEEPDTDEFLKGAVSDWQNVLIEALPHTHFVREPGSEFYYSNVGYAILGAALARAVHEPFITYVEDRILAPLGMQETFFEPSDQVKSRIAVGYSLDGVKIDSSAAVAQLQGRGFKVPPGGLFSTVDDMSKFMAFEMGYGPDSVLSKSSQAKNWDRLLAVTDLNEAGGLGFEWRKLGNSVAVGHDGGVDGYQAEAFVVLKSRIGVVVLASSKGGKLDISNITKAALLGR